MAKKFMKTAKELAWKAFVAGLLDDMSGNFENLTPGTQTDVKLKFENWWSDNYGNRDTTKFIPENNIFVENRRYIQAE
jgi:hypothetical protein